MSTRQLERRRVVGSEVTVGDYYEMHRAGTLWRVEGVRVEADDVTVKFAPIGDGDGIWTTLLRTRERVHVWRTPKKAVGK